MNECPDEAALLDYAEGRLDAAARLELARHLERCESCREIVSYVARRTDRTTNPESLPALGSADEPTRRVDPLLGTTVGGYRIEERIGQGGMGIVYRAVQPVIGKSVAIKVIRSELLRSASLLGRLADEARAANAVGHRGIIDIFGFGTLPGGEHYFVMEYLVGTPLNQHLSAVGVVPLEEAVELLVELLSALSAAHAAGVAHRDLKPSNLFVVHEPDGKRLLKLLDFGLAKLQTTDRPQTAPGAVLGTPHYMSPEQVRGEKSGPESDLYSVGVIAFELLTGRLPFTGSPAEVMRQHVTADAPAPSALVAEVPPALDAIVKKLLSKRREARGTAEQALQALQTAARRLAATATDDATEPSGAPIIWVPAATRAAPRLLPPPQANLEGASPAAVESQRRPFDVKAKRSELLVRIETLRKVGGKDPAAAMLLDDAETKAGSVESAEDVRLVEQQLDAVKKR